MRYSFHPAAKKEFYEVIDYYEDCQMGLGLESALFQHENSHHPLPL